MLEWKDFPKTFISFVSAIGAFTIVEMLFTSSLLAIVGAGEQVCLLELEHKPKKKKKYLEVFVVALILKFAFPSFCLLQPSLSPRRLCLFNTMTGTALRDLNFLTSILAVRMNKKR